ncbi:MAG: phosphopantothenoylcysteine decarboxylase [Streptococcaceae bacterium]|jgi:phosphopantothenoylcysteine decarboxylase|nr:phosphopantothenoylcysteine decarboxylase [Streptococcaceae bacterium]
MKTVVLAVSGSIAAYKAVEITSQLVKLKYNVHIVMTSAATAFITPLTLEVISKNTVTVDVMREDVPGKVNHIELAKQADVFLVAPATANTIAKLSGGIADNALLSIALAVPQQTPKLIASAMNTQMYLNPITQENIKRLKTFGYQEIEPKESMLACGDVGRGALADVSDIVATIRGILN